MNTSFGNTSFQTTSPTNYSSIMKLLKLQESESLEKGDLVSAEEAKLKILDLKNQSVKQRISYYASQNKENIRQAEEQSQRQIIKFKVEWEDILRKLIQNSKQIQQKLHQHHSIEIDQFLQKLEETVDPKIKYSKHVLQLKTKLENHIKVRQYMQAENIRLKLFEAEKSEIQQWRNKIELKKKRKYEELLKKHQIQFKALRVKLESQFNQKIRQRQQKFITLLNKNQKRKVESSKQEFTRTKTNRILKTSQILNTSKSTEKPRKIGAFFHN